MVFNLPHHNSFFYKYLNYNCVNSNLEQLSLKIYLSFNKLIFYLLTWNEQSFLVKKSTIWRAAANPALLFASAVCAPIFLGVK